MRRPGIDSSEVWELLAVDLHRSQYRKKQATWESLSERVKERWRTRAVSVTEALWDEGYYIEKHKSE